MLPPSIAIVIPVLEEEEALRQGLGPEVAGAEEVIISDGGSRDASAELARAAGARVVVGPPGRGAQLNRGGALASSDLLLFLHADTRLAAGALGAARAAAQEGAVGGGFFLRFDDRRAALRLGARLIELRTRLTHCPLGDQAQFVRRDVFVRMGGYREWPVLEDLDFARRLKRQGRIALLHPPVTTAARRYLRGGIARTIATNWLIWGLYFSGVAPERLGRLYRQIR